MQEFFHDINYAIGWEQYKNAAQLNEDLAAPGVEFIWAKNYFPDFPPTVITGDGDGTVNRQSAELTITKSCVLDASERKVSGGMGN
uniref:Acetate--CoA ligase n=1 Tax=Heterorhabditis bacteriophora TaxID=37862 RepID=A0A1I7X271_HETBA